MLARPDISHCWDGGNADSVGLASTYSLKSSAAGFKSSVLESGDACLTLRQCSLLGSCANAPDGQGAEQLHACKRF